MKFDWKQFHKDLDQAIAIMLTETDTLPSNTSLINFIKYSNNKQQEQ